MAKKRKKSTDPNKMAFDVISKTIRKSEISEAARALSKLGASKGGKARAEKLTREQRIEIARIAARARWTESDG